MNEKHLLVIAITLMYRSSQLQHVSDDFAVLVRETLADIKLPEFNLGVNGESKIISALKTTALSMCNELVPCTYGKDELLQRIKVDTAEDVDLYSAIKQGIAYDLEEPDIKKYCFNLAARLKEYRNEKKLAHILNKAAYTIKFERDNIPNFNYRNFVAEVRAALDEFEVPTNDEDPAIIQSVAMSDASGLGKLLSAVQERENGLGKLRTGFQAINRMTMGGFSRGDEIVIGALQHNYKTGFSLTLFKQLALYNKPKMIDPAKKPLMIRISFEDGADNNIHFLYQNIRENETRQPVDIRDVSIEEASQYVSQKMGETGYEILILRVDPTKWTYLDVVNFCLRKEAEGFEIHVLMLDYMTMLPTTGCTQGPTGTDVRDMYRRLRNFCNPRGITLITPHQLSTEAKLMIREGRLDFVRELVGKGYYDRCRTVDNEVDLEIFIHIEKVNGRSYLTIQRGKHRKIGVTPDEYLYTVLPFDPILNGIMDDINGPDSSSRKPGAGPVGTKEEFAFWD